MDRPSQLLEIRPKQQIIDRCREVIHRARRRFLKRNTRPCPLNCKSATMHGNSVSGCAKCNSYDANRCMRPEMFVQIYTKDELAEQFREELYDKQILFRRYPAIGVLLWVLGVVQTADDETIEIDDVKMKGLEKKGDVTTSKIGY